MKRLVKFLLLMGILVSSTFWQTVKVKADVIPNPDGSVTINKEDIIKKIKIEGTTKPAVIENGIVKYQLTEYKPEPPSEGTTGAIYLEDRLSAKDSFTFKGYMKSYNPKITSRLDYIGDGQSLIFHSDDSKFYGESGSNLGILGLKNARGLVYDVFYNNTLDASFWQSGQALQDPGRFDTFYFQGWSTDTQGRGKRETDPVHYNKRSYVNGDKKEVIMSYDANDRKMKFDVSFEDFSSQHILSMPQSQDYFYFASTASTGWATGTFDTYIESITYTPYRKKTIQYIDADSKKELKEYQETKEVKLNEKYFFQPKPIPGYDVVDIEGKLEGTILYEENLNDEFVKVYLRKQETIPTYDVVELKNTTLSRQVVKGVDQIEFRTEELDIPTFRRPVSKITITTPKGISRDMSQSTVRHNWFASEYQTDNKNVYQIYNANYDNVLTQQESLKNKSEVKYAIENFCKFKVDDNSDKIDEKTIQIELSNYPMPYFENQKETQKIGYIFPKLNDVDFNEMLAYDEQVFNPLIPVNTNFLSYRGIRADKSSALDDTDFLKQTLVTKGVATTDNHLILGNFYQNLPITQYLVKYDLTKGLTGVDEMKSVPKIGIPQPVVLQLKDTLGNDLGRKEIENGYRYRLGDTIYSSQENLPKIPGYHFYGIENSDIKFPIKVTNKKQEIVVIYEADQLYWGEVPWEFNQKTGELIFTDGGTLSDYTTSPWNRKDKYCVNSDLIKKITIKAPIKAPQDSNLLFSIPNGGLTKVEYIDGLEKLDTSQVNRMSNMFRHMYNLKELNLSSFNTSQVTNMGSMFRGLISVGELDLSSFETTNKTDMNNMFTGMNKLKVLTLGDKTSLYNTSLITPKGTEFTGKWQSIGKGTLGKPTGDFVGIATELEKKTQKAPINETYVWEPVMNIDLTINYLLLGNNDIETDIFIIENLEKGKRKKAYNEKLRHQHSSIKEFLKANDIEMTPEFEGYDFITEKTTTIINETQEKITLDSKLPKEDLTINFYFKPKVELNVPDEINFGVRQKSDWLNIYSMEPSKIETNNKISIIDTFETNKKQPDWNLYASTEGFYNEESGVRLLADIMFKSPDFNETKVISKESTPLYEDVDFYKKDIFLTDKNQEEGLFVRVAKVQELGKYNGILKYKLEVAP